MFEIWKNIVNLGDHVQEKYEVSNMGRIRNYDTKNILNPYVHKDGKYQRRFINFKFKDYTKGGIIGKMVLSAFIPQTTEDKFVFYKNGDQFDDRLENLEWSSTHKVANRLGNRSRRVLATNKSGVQEICESVKDAAEFLQCHVDTVYRVINNGVTDGSIIVEYEDIEPNNEIKELDFTDGDVQVSYDGLIKSQIGGWSKGSKNGEYYAKNIQYNKDGSRTGYNGKTYRVHNLIAHAFLGERPDKYVVDHINGDKLDNHVENLRYVTQGQNMINAGVEGSGKKKVYQYDLEGIYTGLSFDSMSDASVSVGKNPNDTCIGMTCRYMRKSAFGFKWSMMGPDDYDHEKHMSMVEEHNKEIVSSRREKKGPPKFTGKTVFVYFGDEYRGEFKSGKDVAAETGCGTANISACIAGKISQTKGFSFSRIRRVPENEEDVVHLTKKVKLP